MYIGPRWLISLSFILIIFSLLCGWMEGVYLEGTGAATTFDTLLNPRMALYTDEGAQSSSTFSIAWEWLQALVGALTFDYAFFTGGWMIIRLFFVAIGVGVLVSLASSILRIGR